MKRNNILKVNEDISLHGCREEYVGMVAAAVARHRNYLAEWLPWAETSTIEDTRSFMRSAHLHNMGGRQLNTWIFHRGEFCGAISFNKINPTHQAGEIGYWLSADYMGRGIMTLACRRLIRHGFEKKGLNRIEIRVAAGNFPSQGIPERLGFRLEGVARQSMKHRGVFHDMNVYALLKSEFE